MELGFNEDWLILSITLLTISIIKLKKKEKKKYRATLQIAIMLRDIKI